MFQPIEGFIGLRYVRSRRRRGVVSFMTGASLLGIALGVAALIVILSVMNGLETELRTRLLSLSADARVWVPRVGVEDWRAVRARLEAEPAVAGSAPYVMLEGMLGAGANLKPALIRGILPEEEQAVSELTRFIAPESLAALVAGERRIILGRVLALNLGVRDGDRITLLVPRVEDERLVLGRAAFEVAGVFEAGLQDHDAQLALMHLADASALAGLDGRAEGLAIRVHDPLGVRALQGRLGALDGGFQYTDWTEEHASYFRAIRIEKTMMTVILMFIVGVAAFNIVASLMMVVTDKQRDIAILRTCGLEPNRVARVFLVQGCVIGLAGMLVGTGLGLALAFNVETIVPWLEQTFGFQIMPGDVYYVTEIPSEVHAFDVLLVSALAFAVAVLATVYPARRAAAIAPAAVLRYE
jgi:lipoprotein-releasing system permease protein